MRLHNLIAGFLTCQPILKGLAKSHDKINRYGLVTRYNPIRTSSNPSTPLQIGNGNFAFGGDITGLQTFLPFNTLSSWGWKNDSLPAGFTEEDIELYKGVSWPNHGRPVQYDFGGGNPVEQWLISNPNRVNLGRIGLAFMDDAGMVLNVTESDLDNTTQTLDLWSGVITSTFSFRGTIATVKVSSADSSDAIAIHLDSKLVNEGRVGIFLDFPWCDGTAKFSAPFVGRYDVPSNHTTTLKTSALKAVVEHQLDAANFVTTIAGNSFDVKRVDPIAHRYLISNPRNREFSLTISFGLSEQKVNLDAKQVFEESKQAWEEYWSNNGFIDLLTDSKDSRADELQRRIILSRYLMRVNEAGDTPPQEVSSVLQRFAFHWLIR